MVDPPAIRAGGGTHRRGPLRVRPESDGARPLCDHRFSGYGIFLFRLRLVGGISGARHSAAIDGGLRGHRPGANHEVLRGAADSIARDPVRRLLDSPAERISGASRGSRTGNRVLYRYAHGRGGLLAGDRALLAHQGAPAIDAGGARQPHRGNIVLPGAQASSACARIPLRPQCRGRPQCGRALQLFTGHAFGDRLVVLLPRSLRGEEHDDGTGGGVVGARRRSVADHGDANGSHPWRWGSHCRPCSTSFSV